MAKQMSEKAFASYNHLQSVQGKYPFVKLPKSISWIKVKRAAQTNQ